MDALEVLFAAFYYWRITVCVLFGIALASVLTNLFSLSAEVAHLFAFLAALAGVVWQIATLIAKEAANPHLEKTTISKPIAFLGIACIAGLLGHLIASVFGAMIAIIIVLIAPFLFAPLAAAITKRSIHFHQITFMFLASLIGLATLYGINTFLHT